MTELTSMFLIYFIILGPPQGKQELALATYKYSGAENSLRSYSETYPKNLRFFVSQSVILSSAVSNRYFNYVWEF